MSIRQLSIFVENKTGGIAEAMNVLGNAKIDCCATSIDCGGEYGILRLIADDTDRALDALKMEGFAVKVVEVLGVRVENRPGGLASILNLLKNNDIEIQYLYAFVGKGVEASAVIKVDDNDKAKKILLDNNISLVTTAEINKK